LVGANVRVEVVLLLVRLLCARKQRRTPIATTTSSITTSITSSITTSTTTTVTGLKLGIRLDWGEGRLSSTRPLGLCSDDSKAEEAAKDEDDGWWARHRITLSITQGPFAILGCGLRKVVAVTGFGLETFHFHSLGVDGKRGGGWQGGRKGEGGGRASGKIVRGGGRSRG